VPGCRTHLSLRLRTRMHTTVAIVLQVVSKSGTTMLLAQQGSGMNQCNPLGRNAWPEEVALH
jgi:hypothetical protein